jgi:hypothetical protein
MVSSEFDARNFARDLGVSEMLCRFPNRTKRLGSLLGKKKIAIATVVGLAALSACDGSGMGRLSGKWLNMNGKTVEFTNVGMKTPEGGVEVIDSYKTEGNSVTAYSVRNGSKTGVTYTFLEDDRACAGSTLDTCLVRPDRAGKLNGFWHPETNTSINIGFSATAFFSPIGKFPVESYKFEGDKVSVVYRDERPHNDGSPPTGAVTLSYSFEGADKMCFTRENQRVCLVRGDQGSAPDMASTAAAPKDNTPAFKFHIGDVVMAARPNVSVVMIGKQDPKTRNVPICKTTAPAGTVGRVDYVGRPEITLTFSDGSRGNVFEDDFEKAPPNAAIGLVPCAVFQ